MDELQRRLSQQSGALWQAMAPFFWMQSWTFSEECTTMLSDTTADFSRF